MNKGFVIYASNTKNTRYTDCALTLAKSLKRSMPTCSIALVTNERIVDSLFDHVIDLPYGDLTPYSSWKLSNDWQVYDASPYEYTIKIEADMYIPYSIDYYWDILKQRDLVVCTNIRNFKQELSDVMFYRQFIVKNKLPNTYNGLTYFKKSPTSKRFFNIVRDIFDNWESYKSIFIINKNDPATTDFVYAIASHIIGYEVSTFDNFTDFSFVHMKKEINNIFSEQWSQNLVYEIFENTFRINTFAQTYPIHYVEKDFCYKINGELNGR